MIQKYLLVPSSPGSLHKGKYHCDAKLLFDWFGFISFAYILIINRFTCQVELKPLGQEVSFVAILPLTK